ncbi:MAG: ABC transporter permease subunit [Oscillospiraceae bacterium]|jgi:putative aldouronate transport system permease protein|nr:ABC transporter permease subunit [Oscillospiraceae bacterium]
MMGKASRTFKKMLSHKTLYIMIIPCMIYTFIFSYYPLSGWIMAFQQFKPALGYAGSPFVGLYQFNFLFSNIEFWRAFRNTLCMSLMIHIAGFIFPITFALLLNEIRLKGAKRIVQSVSYLPHFLSWVIVCSLMSSMLSTGNNGAINNLLMSLGLIKEPILFLGEEKYFWWVVTFGNVWKEMGWNSIIYIAAISGVDPALYESASLDGANRYQKMWHVTLSGIRSTIVVLLIMNLGWILNAGFEVQYLLGGGLLADVSQTIDIFVIKYGINIGNYSLATAAGIFKSVISIVMVFGTNKIANMLGESSLL